LLQVVDSRSKTVKADCGANRSADPLRGHPSPNPCRWRVSGWARAVSFAFAFAILFQSHADADDRPPQNGVTILVHGLVVADGVTKPPLEYWGGENLAHLLARFGSGLVWLFNTDTRRFDNVTHETYLNGERWIPRVPNEPGRLPLTYWTPAFAGQQILLFDWTAASGERESGQAEAAADELFAALLAFRVDEEPIITLSPPFAHAVRPMHFIGHSRGTVVVSECVQRLGRSNVPVNHVTYLDPHDFGQPGIDWDEYFHDPAVQVWHNVDHADVFYQKTTGVVCINPHGRPLQHLNRPSGSPIPELQRNLTNLHLFDRCEPGLSPHGRVKDYYWATVARNASAGSYPPNAWFDGGNGSGHGFDRWFQNGGYRQPRDERITRINAGEADVALEYYWSPPDERGGSDRNDVPPILFNGDFELPDLDGGIGLTQASSLAGWSYYGGGGRATVRESGGNHALELARMGGLQVEATHNRFYLPKTSSEVRFAYWGRVVPLLGEHTLEVLIGNRLLRAFTVAETSGFEVRTASLTGHPDLLGGANSLTFRLKTNAAGTANTTGIWLDNISIFEGRTVNRIVSFDRASDGDFHLRWESWPPRSHQLEAALDGLPGSWIPINPLIQRASSGTVSIEHPGAPSAFYRLRLSP
jgi:hypothetical protein